MLQIFDARGAESVYYAGGCAAAAWAHRVGKMRCVLCLLACIIVPTYVQQ